MGIAINSKVPTGFALNGKNIGGLAVNGAVVWQKNTIHPTEYLTFQSDTAFRVYLSNSAVNGALYISTNAVTWDEWDCAYTDSSSDGTLYMAGVGNGKIVGSLGTNNGFRFSGASNLRVSGNIETLLDWEMVANGERPSVTRYCFTGLFMNCTALTQAPEFPEFTMTPDRYAVMFYGCTNLTTPPVLPATTLSTECYYGMFYGCTSLTTIPSLPATTLGTLCYEYMFYGCSNLKISETQTEDCPYQWSIPASGTIDSEATNWNLGMLFGTGGTFTDDPAINTIYYVEHEPV